MTANIHRALTFLGSVCASAGGILGGGNLIDPQTGAWIAAIGGLLIAAANAWRIQWPDKPAP